MGIAFAHAGLGFPMRWYISARSSECPTAIWWEYCLYRDSGSKHGTMRATAVRLGRVEEAFCFGEEVTDSQNAGSDKLLEWLEECISKLFGHVDLPTSLGQAGLTSLTLIGSPHKSMHLAHRLVSPDAGRPKMNSWTC